MHDRDCISAREILDEPVSLCCFCLINMQIFPTSAVTLIMLFQLVEVSPMKRFLSSHVYDQLLFDLASFKKHTQILESLDTYAACQVYHIDLASCPQ